MERRSHPRRQVVRNGLLYHPRGYSFPCRIVNASFGGLFVRATGARIHKGNYVEVTINASPSMAEPTTVQALVVHQKNDGIGLLLENAIPLHALFNDWQ
jgi:hypothetical protein